MNKFDGIIFDIDGVLIDDTKSCQLAILKTVNFYLRQNGIKAKASKKDVHEIKSIPGFNNDWYASFELIKLLSKRIIGPNFKKQAKQFRLSDKNNSKYIYIKDIWQNFYLGSRDFEKIEKREAPFINKKPLRLKEKSFITTPLLKQLIKAGIKLGIATSRPREQAIFSLKRLKLKEFFTDEYLVGQEDVSREKPFPDPLIEAIRRMEIKKPVYVGDTINDCLAAQKAKIPCVYVGKELLGDYQINDVNQLGVIL